MDLKIRNKRNKRNKAKILRNHRKKKEFVEEEKDID